MTEEDTLLSRPNPPPSTREPVRLRYAVLFSRTTWVESYTQMPSGPSSAAAEDLAPLSWATERMTFASRTLPSVMPLPVLRSSFSGSPLFAYALTRSIRSPACA